MWLLQALLELARLAALRVEDVGHVPFETNRHQVVAVIVQGSVLVFEDQAALQRAVASPPVGFTVTPVAMPDGSTPLGRRKRKAVDVDGTASGDDDEVMGDATGGGGGEPVFGHQAQSKRPRAANSKPSTIDGIPDMDEAQVLRRMMAREARPG